MRAIIVSLVLIVSGALQAAGLEVEQTKVFPAHGDSAEELRILSTTDLENFAPLIEAFRDQRPDVSVSYTVAASQAVFGALYKEGLTFDLVISSAMDLQMKLVNDGFAQSHQSPQTEALPPWAAWGGQLFAFAQEPVVAIVSKTGLDGLTAPRTRREIIGLLRAHPDKFAGRIGTYDPNLSGAGYLFATQDARQSETYWSLAEHFGALDPQLYAASAAMIEDVRSGELTLAYNVLGSYARLRLGSESDVEVIELEDYTLTLLRTAFVPADAERADLGKAFLDALLSDEGRRRVAADAQLPPIDEAELSDSQHLRTIRLDPGLLVYVDPIKRKRFLDAWNAAVTRR